LYFKALLDGIFSGVSNDPKFRITLEERARVEGIEVLHQELSKVDAEAAKKIKNNDLRRIIRALEVFYSTGVTLSAKKKEARGLWGKLPIKVFGLRFDRALLYDRVNKRVDWMFDAGAIDEIKALADVSLSITASRILGIKEIRDFLAGRMSLEQVKEKMKQKTRNYAKRQMTWFNADKRVEWIDVNNMGSEEIADYIMQIEK
jgi:tRNA dimethylallyltransferase